MILGVIGVIITYASVGVKVAVRDSSIFTA